MTGMGVVIFHRVCGSPGTSRPRNHRSLPSSSSLPSLLPLRSSRTSSFLSFTAALHALVSRDFSFFFLFLSFSLLFLFPFGNFVARWLLGGYRWFGGIESRFIGYGFALYYLRDMYIYVGIFSGNERFS